MKYKKLIMKNKLKKVALVLKTNFLSTNITKNPYAKTPFINVLK
jgi:hypothetical protein